ncbi:MAG: toxin-antitoxin system YwqK family antitoxin [Flavobacteriales bacterium]|nr:toxin-antitoxin system YwqK family antitoxin [Flavobacteriales bacterium]
MKTLGLSFACAALLLASFSFAQPAASINQKDALGRKQGPWERTWADSKQLRYTGQFKDDKPVGVFTYFSTSGKVESTLVHYAKGGVAHGKHFHPNGKLMAEGRYVGEAKDSTWNYFDAEGHLRSSEHWSKGERNGEQMMFDVTGQPIERFNFKDDQRHGLCQEFHDNGQVKNTSQYVNGLPEGVQTFYYRSGKKEIEGRNIAGVPEGSWTYYHEDGSVQIELLYNKGEFVKDKKENGTFKEYFDSEQVKSEVTYKNGFLNGPFVEYYDNGTWTTRPVLVGPKGQEMTQEERVLEGQTRKREGTYKNDLLEGEVKEYDEKGRMISNVRYVAGKPVAP